MESLKYIDEEDKIYGLTGMAIAIVVWDEAEAIDSINVDGSVEDSLLFASDYVYGAPTGVSVKKVWEHNFLHYRLCLRLLLANVVCRHYMLQGNKPMKPAMEKLMRDILREEGVRQCALEADEIESVFTKNYDTVHRVFRHSGVQQIARDFAATLRESRYMSVADIIDNLSRLRMI